MIQDLIQVDGKFYKKHKVVMLPTIDESSRIVHNNYKFTPEHGQPLLYLNENITNLIERGLTPQHLYFLSDEEIKVGDWYYSKAFNDYYQAIALPLAIKDAVKIIATTDPKLITKGECNCTATTYEGCSECLSILPRPSDAFIKSYCEQGGIDEVLIEYKERLKWLDGSGLIAIKVAPDNTIMIKELKVKDSWSRDELISLCDSAYNVGHDAGLLSAKFNSGISFEDWIEKNL